MLTSCCAAVAALALCGATAPAEVARKSAAKSILAQRTGKRPAKFIGERRAYP
jgi:hypothetical protein